MSPRVLRTVRDVRWGNNDTNTEYHNLSKECVGSHSELRQRLGGICISGGRDQYYDDYDFSKHTVPELG